VVAYWRRQPRLAPAAPERPAPGHRLRFVVLADRLYDKDVPILASGVPFDQLFTEEMMTGGYMKKYFRAVSRLTALAREGQNHEPS